MIAADLASLAVSVDSLVLLPGNARRGDVGAVAASLRQFGQRKPLVARRSDSAVLAGNHTLMAARSLGWDEVAVVWVDDDDVTGKAFALADNRASDLGGYDEAALAALLVDVDGSAPDLIGSLGWSSDELEALLRSAEVELLERADKDDVPAPRKVAVTVPGDLWLLGTHSVFCGDATAGGVESVMGSELADMVWTDPPYGVGYVGKTADALVIDNDDLDADALGVLLRLSLTAACDATRAGGSWWVAAPPGPPFLQFAQVLNDLGVWRQTLVWLKNVLVMGRSDYHYRHEALFYGWKPGGRHTGPPNRTQDSIIEIARPSRSTDHPTMKPVDLIAYAILNHTQRDALILDPFGGSGSTLLAAHQEGRRARLVEIDPIYVDVICRRFQKVTGIVPIHSVTGRPHDFGD